MAIQTKRMSDWLAQNGQAITNASKEAGQLYDGVFIMYHRKSDGFPVAVRVSDWTSRQNSGEIADGVLIVEGGHHLVVAPTGASSNLKWSSKPTSSSSNDGVSISGVTTTGDRMTAFDDWKGRANTTAIINGSTSTNITNTAEYAAGFCNQYSRVNANNKGLTAGRWWLPSLAELRMIWANFDKVNYALSKIEGATQLSTDWHWSSTQYSANYAWYLGLGDGHMNYRWKFAQHEVRPVSAFLQ